VLICELTDQADLKQGVRLITRAWVTKKVGKGHRSAFSFFAANSRFAAFFI
jgi:hypothetical protein